MGILLLGVKPFKMEFLNKALVGLEAFSVIGMDPELAGGLPM